jgi:hypothetical protein
MKYLLLVSHNIDDLFCEDFSCYVAAAPPYELTLRT